MQTYQVCTTQTLNNIFLAPVWKDSHDYGILLAVVLVLQIGMTGCLEQSQPQMYSTKVTAVQMTGGTLSPSLSCKADHAEVKLFRHP